jgi:ankyrin repeat protein
MKMISRNVASAMWIAVSLVMVSSCHKTTENSKTDLEEVGYQLTAEDWFRASRDNDVGVLKKFVASKFVIDTRDGSGDSALHATAAGGAQAAAGYLLDLGLDVDLRGGSDRTPLMAAVMADQTAMVRWLIRQGANPLLKDKEGFRPLMLAVSEGRPGSVGELAASSREDLDPALLLAALAGRADVIDALTNFGASVYTQMEDGRTPLMIAAENGHFEAVKILLEMGAGRFTTDPDGRTAADLAIAAGHPGIAELINHSSVPADLVLDSPVEIAKSMDAFVDAAAGAGGASSKVAGAEGSPGAPRPLGGALRAGSRPISGEVLSRPVASKGSFFAPPLVMRHFREKEVPLSVKSVQGDTATVILAGPKNRELKVRAGDTIPGSSLVVVRVRRRMEDSKVNLGRPAEISVMEVRDSSTGVTREWISGVPPKAHDPVALVEDAATGRRYLASPGQRFSGEGGGEYLISDVRPNQLVIQEVATGEVRTIPLQGPRG